jgi:TolB-like protein
MYRDFWRPHQTTQHAALPEVGLAHAPRLSLVVLPLNNLGGVDNDTVDGITEDLTTNLARIPGLLVIARNSAFTYKDKPIDIRRVGEELGVRYAVEGSARKHGDAMRITIQLVSTETGSHILAENYDISREGASYNVDDVVHQVAVALNVRLVYIESARSVHERSENPDVDDLIVRAQAIRFHVSSPQTQKEVVALYERAVSLDPSSVRALAGLADAILGSILIWTEDPTAPTKLKRAEDLIKRAEALRPDDIFVLWNRVYLLAKLGRCAELIPAAQKSIELNPNASGSRLWLGYCLMSRGESDGAIAEFKQALRVNPRADVWNRYMAIGHGSLFLGHYDEAVSWFQKSMAASPNDSALAGAGYAAIASAQALEGRLDNARHSGAEAMRLLPLITARSYWPFSVSGPAVAQVARMRDGLRLAGIRDHADEDADTGVASDDALHSNYESPTPNGLPGARTIHTSELQALLERRPLVIDVSWPYGKSISGAIGLWGAGISGDMSDAYQERLKRKFAELAHANRELPIVTVGWNAERYQGRNLALRLVALGYSNVYWYRGGREAWETADLPETDVAMQEW